MLVLVMCRILLRACVRGASRFPLLAPSLHLPLSLAFHPCFGASFIRFGGVK